MSAENKLRAAIAQSYADFRTEQAARGRPVCDAFEPCKAAQSEPHPWSTAPDFTPCGRCGWSRRTHDPGIECGPIDPVRVPDREGAHLMPLHCPRT